MTAADRLSAALAAANAGYRIQRELGAGAWRRSSCGKTSVTTATSRSMGGS